MSQTIYDYTAKDLHGKEVNFTDYKGKVLLIVNTASECGYTPQYGTLEELYQMYKDRGLVVIGFPSANFFQEPLEGEEAAAFCQKNYGVTFPMMEKANVIGFTKHPVYKFLSNKSRNGKIDSSPKWNFYKYLVDREGKVVEMYPSTTEPGDEVLIAQIEKLLG